MNFDLQEIKKKRESLQRAAEAGTLTAEQQRQMSPEQKAAMDKMMKERQQAMAKNKELNDAFNQGMEALKAKQCEQATQAFEKAAVLDPKQVAVLGNMAEAYVCLAGQKTVDVRMDWRQAILSTIARPEILFLLLLGALAGLGAEISHPGLVFPGVLGALCLILFLFASQIIPVNWAGVLLVVLAIGLFIAEVKVASYGLLTVGGLVAMILGAMMLVDSPLPELRVDPWKLFPVILAFAAFTIALVRLVIQAQRRRPQTGAEGLVGRRGEAETGLDPEGWVIVQGERWRASAAERVLPGEKVEVQSVEGLLLRVRKGA